MTRPPRPRAPGLRVPRTAPCLLLAVLCTALAPDAAAHAQPGGAPTPFGWERLTALGAIPLRDTLPSLLRGAGLLVDAPAALPAPWRRLAVTGGTAHGGWHRPQEAARRPAAEATLEGERPAAGAWTHGRLAYRRGVDEGVEWRQHAAPYVGLPYEWADSVGGAFHHDALSLAAGVTTTPTRRVQVAVATAYDVLQGARRNDPRPLHRTRDLSVRPAVAWRQGAHLLAVGVHRHWHREELEIGGGTSPEAPVLFRLRGIGTFDRTQLIAAERTVLGGTWGLQGGYAYHGARWRWALGGEGAVVRDSVRDGIATPVPGGDRRSLRGAATFALRRLGVRPVEVTARWTGGTVRGRDPVFAAINAGEVGQVARVGVRAWSAPVRAEARWEAAAEWLTRRLSREDLATETRWDVTGQGLGIGLRRRQPLPGGALLVQVRAAGHVIPREWYEARRPTRITPVLAAADFAVVAAPGRELGAEVGWEGGPLGAPRLRVHLAVEQAARTGRLPSGPRGGSWQHVALRIEWL